MVSFREQLVYRDGRRRTQKGREYICISYGTNGIQMTIEPQTCALDLLLQVDQDEEITSHYDFVTAPVACSNYYHS